MSESSERYERQAKRYIASAETRKGELDFGIYKAVEQLDGALQNTPGYVGVAGFGSRLRGYAKKDSDYDAIIFYDGSLNSDFAANSTNVITNAPALARRKISKILLRVDDEHIDSVIMRFVE